MLDSFYFYFKGRHMGSNGCHRLSELSSCVTLYQKCPIYQRVALIYMRPHKSNIQSTNSQTATLQKLTDGISANDYNGLCSFKCSMPSIIDTAEDRHKAKWVDKNGCSQSESVSQMDRHVEFV